MGFEFSADEILQIAERIEINGAAFYRKAAGQFADAEVRAFLEDLARIEDSHRNVFAAMRADLAAGDKGSWVFDPDGETAQYLQAFANGSVFDTHAKPADKLKGGESVEDILKTAIGLEKDSIVFYLGVGKMVGGASGKSQVDRIVDEEVRHVRTLASSLAVFAGRS